MVNGQSGSVFIENGGNTQKVYESLLVQPENLSIFSSTLARHIITELAKKPMCAMDLARRLGQHEQKIYYHLRKMVQAGIVRLDRSEARYGMTAKIYALVSPVIAAKLYEDGCSIENVNAANDPHVKKFLHPFIIDGKLNAKIIIGAPMQHGTYVATARDGVYLIGLGLFLGKFLNGFNVSDSYRLDIEIDKHEDLKNNLILIGSPKINTVVDKINRKLPIYFDMGKEWAITSTFTGNIYNYDDDAVILKVKNPLNKKKELLLCAGRRSHGLRSAIIAFAQHTSEIMKGNIEDEKIIAKVVRGIDKDGDGIVDSVTFME